MKNALKVTAGVTLLAGMVFMASCSKGSEKPSSASTSFESYSGESTYALKGSAENFKLDKDLVCNDAVSLVMPMTLNGKDAAKVRDSIMTLALNNTDTDVNAAIGKWLTAEAKEFGFETEKVDVEASTADGFCHVRGYVTSMTPDMFVYCVTTDTYNPRAANGLSVNEYINYSIADDKILSLGDLFTADGLKQLPALIAGQAENIPAYAGEVNITALPSGGNFYLSDRGEIVFSYAPLEVGPHSLGTVEVAFYPYELVNYMTPKAVNLFGLSDIK